MISRSCGIQVQCPGTRSPSQSLCAHYHRMARQCTQYWCCAAPLVQRSMKSQNICEDRGDPFRAIARCHHWPQDRRLLALKQIYEGIRRESTVVQQRRVVELSSCSCLVRGFQLRPLGVALPPKFGAPAFVQSCNGPIPPAQPLPPCRGRLHARKVVGGHNRTCREETIER
eukprot:SAG31_NODE_5123_length_2727_cov_1.896119_3_plen_171_part_00